MIDVPNVRSRGLRALLVLAFPALLSGCTTGYQVHPGTLGAATVSVSPDEKDILWRRAVGVLLDQGYVPQVLNESACFISARRREDIADDAFARTIAIFTISPEGVARLEVSGAGLFSSEAQFVAAVRDRQITLLSLITERTVRPAEHG